MVSTCVEGSCSVPDALGIAFLPFPKQQDEQMTYK